MRHRNWFKIGFTLQGLKFFSMAVGILNGLCNISMTINSNPDRFICKDYEIRYVHIKLIDHVCQRHNEKHVYWVLVAPNIINRRGKAIHAALCLWSTQPYKQ